MKVYWWLFSYFSMSQVDFFIIIIKIQGRRYPIYLADMLMATNLRPFFLFYKIDVLKPVNSCFRKRSKKKIILLKAFSDLRNCGFEEEMSRGTSVLKFWPKNGSHMKSSSLWLWDASHGFSLVIFFIRISNISKAALKLLATVNLLFQMSHFWLLLGGGKISFI